jgi:Family of unknown function (DUF6011)
MNSTMSTSNDSVDEAAWRERLRQARLQREQERAQQEHELHERRVLRRQIWEPVMIPAIPVWDELRELIIEAQSLSKPKWRFILAPDFALEVQPRDSVKVLFEGLALFGPGITREHFLMRRPLVGVAELRFRIVPASPSVWSLSLRFARADSLGIPATDRIAGHLSRKARLIEEGVAPLRYSTHTLTTLTSHHCLCCGRGLTDPASQQRRIGPECAQKPGVRGWLRKHWGHLALAES